MKKIIYRAKQPTPPFFRKLRKAGLILAGVSAAVLAAPVSLPGILVTIAGYTSVAGGVAGAISQLTVGTDQAFRGLMANPIAIYHRRLTRIF